MQWRQYVCITVFVLWFNILGVTASTEEALTTPTCKGICNQDCESEVGNNVSVLLGMIMGQAERFPEYQMNIRISDRQKEPDNIIGLLGSCYEIEKDYLTWENARAQCQSRGNYDLVSIETEVEKENVRRISQAVPDCLWSSGRVRSTNENVWFWNATNQNIDYNDWGIGQPYVYGAPELYAVCVTQFNPGWYARRDTNPIPSICEKLPKCTANKVLPI